MLVRLEFDAFNNLVEDKIWSCVEDKMKFDEEV